MEDFGSFLVRRYGAAALAISAAAALFIWSLAHWTAAPGTEVSVLWGFVKYTKTDALRSPLGAIGRQLGGEKSAPVGEPHGSLTAISLEVQHGASVSTAQSSLVPLRSKRQLRNLTFAESGRTVQETPPGTYFFVRASSLLPPRLAGRSYYEFVTQFMRLTVSRYGTPKSDLEIHYVLGGQPMVVVFVDETTASRITQLSGKEDREFMATPNAAKSMTSVVSLPLGRIKRATWRVAEESPANRLLIFDFVVQ